MHAFASRRSFLGSAAGALTLVRSGGAAPKTDDAADLRLGVASYSFREFQRQLAIADTRKLNIRYINIKDFHLPLNSTPGEIAQARQEFNKAGLTILGGGNISFPTTDEDDIHHKFEYAKLAGMPVIVCAPTHETLPLMEKYVKQYDIKIAITTTVRRTSTSPLRRAPWKRSRTWTPAAACVSTSATPLALEWT
jgi:hypothetical protein